jgi:hypothetical protein
MSKEMSVAEVEELIGTFFSEDNPEVYYRSSAWHEWKEVSGEGFTQRFIEAGNEEIRYPGVSVTEDNKVMVYGEWPNYEKTFRDATPEEATAWKAYREYRLAYEEFKEGLSPEDDYITVPGCGRVTVVEDFGGEGEGERYYLIFRVDFEDGSCRYFKMNGWYASYDGGYYDGPFEEVKPVDRTITFYE